MLEVGTPAPQFSLSDQQGNHVALSDYLGQWVILWWYPEAHTPGCTLQAGSMQKHLSELEAEGVVVLGASFDAPSKNNDFAGDCELSMPLLSDTETTVGQAYGVMREQDDPSYHRPLRETFIIDPRGDIAFAENAQGMDLAQYGSRMLDIVRALKSA